MKRRGNRRGFTMAEMLIVVAIIGVLSGVAFVAVAQHQRSLERLERDSVAREIFVAAQNHLTMAQGQGYLGIEEYGEPEGSDVYYFTVYQGDNLNDPPQTLLDLMLPFGAIDETVRGGGSYIIRYHQPTATVMDVFYCSTDDRFGYDLTGTTPADLLSGYGEGKESARRNFNGKVLGWYGGVEASTLVQGSTPLALQDPIIAVENAEKLRVLVKDNSAKDLKVIVTGVDSGAKVAFTLKSSSGSGGTNPRTDTNGVTFNGESYAYAIILDDITQADLHFADLVADTGAFKPGEDVTVQAIAFDNSQISNIAYSAEITTNSLFEKIALEKDANDNDILTASVNNIRHLENLDPRISDVSITKSTGAGNNAMSHALQGAKQTNDLSWATFKANTDGDSTVIHARDAGTNPTDASCYMPIEPNGLLSYDGQSHSISKVKVNHADDVGLFGSVSDIIIENLALLDFDITQSDSAADTTNAGALAGTLANATVKNVVAYDLNAESQITAGTGSAGGLVGSMTDTTLEKCAASVYVTSTAKDAGGLVGNTNKGSITGCYSGGHTIEDPEGSGSIVYDNTSYNVTASAGYAGGLIGVDVSTPVTYSYSTCSATGKAAGGFVADAVADITNCYATGLVLGTDTETVDGETVSKDGAFAYSLTGNATNCNYFEIINERPAKDDSGNETDGREYLTALGKKGSNANILPLDADFDDDPDAYEDFIGDPTIEGDEAVWKAASAYNDTLIEYYAGKYNLKTVSQLGAPDVIEADTTDPDTNVTTPADFVSIHRGDWPMPEIFVIND